MNKRFIIVLIAFMNMIVPLSLDMYLPAVPHMTAAFNTTESTVNLTLVGFFFFMAIGTLIFGPLSDKYGRRGLLVAGTLVYTIFSAACALATSIWLLIIARVLQALGAGCMVAISTAMIKDCFDRRTRNTILAVVQAMAVIAPMLAPIVGAFIVTHAGWRATFAVLAVLGAGCTISLVFLKETLAAAACGVLLLVFGSLLPLAFLLCFLPFTIIESLLRPMSTAVLLNQQEKDTGSASSLINFVNTVLGSLGMVLAPILSSNYVHGLGILLVVFALIACALWIVVIRGLRSGLKGMDSVG